MPVDGAFTFGQAVPPARPDLLSHIDVRAIQSGREELVVYADRRRGLDLDWRAEMEAREPEYEASNAESRSRWWRFPPTPAWTSNA